MAKKINKKDFLRIVGLLALQLFVLGCSIGTSFKANEIRSFKGTLIPELSSEPILIEKVSIELIEKERSKQPLNLPLSLLNYSESYKVGSGDASLYVYGETERLSAALARAAINPIFEKTRMMVLFIQMQVF